jgi:pimeloyl-ACP methyl ester carboxylesterase
MLQETSGKFDGIHYSVRGEGKPLVFLHCGMLGSRVVRYPGVGHIANMECPEQFNKDVLKFLMTG